MSFFLLCPLSLSLILSPPTFHSSTSDNGWGGHRSGIYSLEFRSGSGAIRQVIPRRASNCPMKASGKKHQSVCGLQAGTSPIHVLPLGATKTPFQVDFPSPDAIVSFLKAWAKVLWVEENHNSLKSEWRENLFSVEFSPLSIPQRVGHQPLGPWLTDVLCMMGWLIN